MWIIYYDDGTTFSEENGSPEEAPGRGVQLIAEDDSEVGSRFQEGKDYYIRRGNQWIGVDLVGMIDQLTEQGIIKQGRMLTDREFAEIRKRALADHRVKKSNWHPDERKD